MNRSTDYSTWLGIALGAAAIGGSIAVSGGSLRAFWDNASLLMVLGGTTATLLVCVPWEQLRRTPQVCRKLFLSRRPNLRELSQQIVDLAERARREGILSLESEIEQFEDPFLRQGLQLVVDGTPPDTIEDILRTEIDAMSIRHKEGRFVFDQIGRFAPAMGMLGTLLGLIIMLGQITDPTRIGTGMAVAMLTTLYGLLLSNASSLPCAERLSLLSRQEVIAREMIVRGLLALQAGEAPRVIAFKLQSFLSPRQRDLTINRPRPPRRLAA